MHRNAADAGFQGPGTQQVNTLNWTPGELGHRKGEMGSPVCMGNDKRTGAANYSESQ